jgi:PAN domain
LTNQTASTESNLETNTNLITALANQSQLYIANTSCPYTNLTKQESSAGVDFTVYCNTEVSAGFYSPWSTEFNPTHVDSLEECMDICAEAHPLCRAASWNPGMIHGYQNCYLYDDSSPIVDFSAYILHTVVMDLPDLAAGCPTNTNYTSSSSNDSETTFGISCSQEATSATNLTFVHETNITSCMDRCASWSDTPACEAIIFDPTMGIGYENCQLLNSVNLVASASNVNYASIVSSNSSSPATSSSSSSSSSGGSSSKAWIAGPVIGGIAAVAAIGLGFWWWNRRKRNNSAAPLPANPQTGEYNPVYPPGYVAGSEPVELPKNSVERASNFHELSAQEGHAVHELPE